MLAILIHTHFQQMLNVFFLITLICIWKMDDTIWKGTGNSESVNLWSRKGSANTVWTLNSLQSCFFIWLLLRTSLLAIFLQQSKTNSSQKYNYAWALLSLIIERGLYAGGACSLPKGPLFNSSNNWRFFLQYNNGWVTLRKQKQLAPQDNEVKSPRQSHVPFCN